MNTPPLFFFSRTATFFLTCLPLLLWGQNCPQASPTTPPWLIYPSQPFRHVAPTSLGARAANVYLMDLPGGLGRPFVFVEGIDFGLSGTENDLQLGDFGWQAFNGCALDRYPMMANMPILIDSVLQRGFHPVLVDFEEGDGDIFANATLLADILRHLSDHAGDPRPMVISGASMGGQIARIALRMMELEGEPHCTQLFVSLDSPHCGANVPIGLQHIIDNLPASAEAVSALSGALHSAAARQLLLKQLVPMAMRFQYQDSLDAIGWPQFARNAGIANGALTPVGDSNEPLLDYEYAILSSEVIGDIGGLLDLEVHADPGLASHPLSGANGPVTSVLEMPSGGGWPWPLDLSVGNDPVGPSNWGGSLDLMPGGTRPSLEQFVSAFNDALADMDLPWPLQIPDIGANQFQPLHSFIPTASALGIAPPWSGLTLSTILDNTPFDAVHLGSSNEPHSEVNPGNMAFLLAQLEATESPLAPGTLSDTIALSASGHWSLPHLDISGRLGLQSPDLAFGNLAAEPGTHGEFLLSPCADSLIVRPNGVLELGGTGAGGVNSTARLTIPAGTVLHVEGQLIVHPGSELSIAHGAHLSLNGAIVDQRHHALIDAAVGSALQFDGVNHWSQASNSQLEMNAEVTLSDAAHWTQHLSAEARIYTHQAHFSLGHSSTALLEALSPETHWVIGEGGNVSMTGHGAWKHVESGVRFLGGTSWNVQLSGGLHFERTEWRGTAQDSLKIAGDLWIDEHLSHDLHLQQSDGTYRLNMAEFEGGSTSMATNKVRWSGAVFSDHPVVHAALGNEPAHLIEDCRFSQTQDGLSLAGPGRIRIEDSFFSNCIQGLKGSRTARIELSCCAFSDNDIAAAALQALLVMQPQSGGGWNLFHHNDVHFKFGQAPLPAIAGGFNHFGTAYSSWGTGTLDIACEGSGVNWQIDGQSWDWPVAWPQIMGGMWAWNPDGPPVCPVTALDLSPVNPTECREDLKWRRE